MHWLMHGINQLVIADSEASQALKSSFISPQSVARDANQMMVSRGGGPHFLGLSSLVLVGFLKDLGGNVL